MALTRKHFCTVIVHDFESGMKRKESEKNKWGEQRFLNPEAAVAAYRGVVYEIPNCASKSSLGNECIFQSNK